MAQVIGISISLLDIVAGIFQLVLLIGYWAGSVRCNTLVNWTIWSTVILAVVKAVYAFVVDKTAGDGDDEEDEDEEDEDDDEEEDEEEEEE